MIKGTGIDIIDVGRVRRLLERDDRFIHRVFAQQEIAYCQEKFVREQHFAARFTAKEAFLKALGTGYRGDIGWQDIWVENDELGKPRIELSLRARQRFHSLGLSCIHLSISHTREYAVSLVILE